METTTSVFLQSNEISIIVRNVFLCIILISILIYACKLLFSKNKENLSVEKIQPIMLLILISTLIVISEIIFGLAGMGITLLLVVVLFSITNK
ncbi:MAG: hypothetical protein Q3983_07560 [Capnocytophaga sp.]|nr:hypothetical protein [Capnocytophaga sp.]